MPNIVYHRVQFQTDLDTIKKVRDTVKSKGKALDFKKIIPVPEYIDSYPDKLSDDERYWRTYYWGSRHNAFESEWISNYELYFESAWESPEPLLAELSKLCNGDPIVVFTLDEFDYRVRANIYQDGIRVESFGSLPTTHGLGALIGADLHRIDYKEWQEIQDGNIAHDVNYYLHKISDGVEDLKQRKLARFLSEK